MFHLSSQKFPDPFQARIELFDLRPEQLSMRSLKLSHHGGMKFGELAELVTNDAIFWAWGSQV